ncbi:MAG TPA: glycosyl hydrolase family 18 protein [Candidatus Deferrimicrobiaceae bacterium]|nr:glycosyl hydrolase family 18 protein [Candidatus Deferrimicrobiaceae bacterium]
MATRRGNRPLRRYLGPAVLGFVAIALVVVLAGLGAGSGPNANTSPDPSGPGGPDGSGSFLVPTVAPTPTPVPPLGGTELYGFLPYWVMPEIDGRYLRRAPVSTLALFSVAAARDGTLRTGQLGYRRIVGETGAGIIRAAHERGMAVDLVFTSFGERRNERFFDRDGGGPASTDAPWQQTVEELVTLVDELGLDGINVDIERLDPLDRPAYTAFLITLGETLRASNPKARLSVATEASERGAGNAAAAVLGGVDRVFLMGYDYHWSGSAPGASSPVDRLDGIPTLRRSIDWYVEAGVPRDRILLGLPLYGMTWRTLGPDRSWPVVGTGIPWIPADNVDVLQDEAFEPSRDSLEWAEFFAEPDGEEWLITYYDSPATLRAKLALARDAGLAGGGFWALGYEIGLPGYRALISDFRAGEIERDPLS